MAYSGRSEDHYRFYRYSTLLMDVGGDTLRLVIEKFCQRDDLTFHEFLSKYKDDLFHGRKTQHKCTNCPHKPPLSTGGAFDDDQWKQLYIPDTSFGSSVDVDSTSNSQHDSPQGWKVNPSVELEYLEINLIADILHNVRPVLLFYLHGFMHHYGQTNFESFLNHHKHALYHHYREEQCCLCSPQTKKNNDIKIYEKQWNNLFRKSPSCPSCSMPVCCTVYSAKSVQEEQLSMNVLSKVLTLTVPVFQLISSIIKKRHTIYAHPRNDTKMNAETFNREWQHLRGLILQLIEEIKHPELKDEWENRIENLSSFIPTDEQYNELLDRVEEMEKYENKMYQELNEVKKGQKQIFGEVTRKRTDNMKLTKGRIEDHLNGLRVHTDYIEKGKRKLGENGILIFTGISGEGKTWHCLEVLSTLSNQDVVQLDSMRLDISEWDTYVGADRKNIVVWIDDLKAASVQNQKPFFERVQHQLSKRDENICIVISVTNIELERITEYRMNLFKECFIVRLGTKNSREGFEWRQQLLKEFIRLGISKPESHERYVPVAIVENVNEESLNHEPFKISVPTIKKIANINTEIGFPECCRRFCSDPDLFRQGEQFFSFPSESTKNLFIEMANSNDENVRRKLLVICLVLLFPSIDPQDCLNNNISKSLHNILDVSLSGKKAIQRALNGLLSSYLVQDSGKAIRFQHDSLRFAVAIALCEFDRDAVELFILNGPLDLTLNLCNLKADFQLGNQSSSSSFQVDRDLIFHRLVHEMTHNEYRHSIRQIFWYVGTDNQALWTGFMKYVAEKNPTDKRIIEKIIKLNISNPANAFGTEETLTGAQNYAIMFKMFLLRMIPNVDLLYLFILVLFIDISNYGFPSELIFKVLCMVTTEYRTVLHICSERLYVNHFSILHEGVIYQAEKDVKELIDFFDIPCRKNIVVSLYDLAENVPLAYQIRELYLQFATSLPPDVYAAFSGSIMNGLCILQNVSGSTKELLKLSVLNKYIVRAIEDKNLRLLKALSLVIMQSQEFKTKLIEKASIPTFSSYHVSEVVRIHIEDGNVRTGLLKFTCKDIKILQMLAFSDYDLLGLLKGRFLKKEFSFNHICASFPLLRLTQFDENECCRVEQCFPVIGVPKQTHVDCCIVMTEKASVRSTMLNISPSFLFSICNYHFADLIFIEAFSNDSLDFFKAVDEMEVSRISMFSFFTGRLQKHIDEIFQEACEVGSHLMIRHILEEEFDIMDETLSNGLMTSCLKGHSLVVEKILSWKPGMISHKCLSDCIQTTIENSHSQTMAYILTSEQVTSYLRDGSAKGDDILYCNIREAIRKCDEKYLSRILSSFLSKKTITGIVLVINERYPNPM